MQSDVKRMCSRMKASKSSSRTLCLCRLVVQLVRAIQHFRGRRCRILSWRMRTRKDDGRCPIEPSHLSIAVRTASKSVMRESPSRSHLYSLSSPAHPPLLDHSLTDCPNVQTGSRSLIQKDIPFLTNNKFSAKGETSESWVYLERT